MLIMPVDITNSIKWILLFGWLAKQNTVAWWQGVSKMGSTMLHWLNDQYCICIRLPGARSHVLAWENHKTSEHFTSCPPAVIRLVHAKLLWAQCTYQICVKLNTRHTLKDSLSFLFKWLKLTYIQPFGWCSEPVTASLTSHYKVLQTNRSAGLNQSVTVASSKEVQLNLPYNLVIHWPMWIMFSLCFAAKTSFNGEVFKLAINQGWLMVKSLVMQNVWKSFHSSFWFFFHCTSACARPVFYKIQTPITLCIFYYILLMQLFQ